MIDKSIVDRLRSKDLVEAVALEHFHWMTEDLVHPRSWSSKTSSARQVHIDLAKRLISVIIGEIDG